MNALYCTAASIPINGSTSLANLVAGTDTIEFEFFSLDSFSQYGSLGITPTNLTVTKRENAIELDTPSPGFMLFAYSLTPMPGYQIDSVELIDDSLGLDGLVAFGDTTSGGLAEANTNSDVLAGMNSLTGGSITHKFKASQVFAVPEAGTLSWIIAATFFGYLRKRRP